MGLKIFHPQTSLTVYLGFYKPMITRQLNFIRISLQPSTGLKTIHSFQHEHQLVDEIPQPNLASPPLSNLNCLHRNRYPEALIIFKKHLQLGIAHIDETTAALAVKACRGYPKFCFQIHGLALTSGLTSYLSVSNSLMNAYSKSGRFNHAVWIFEKLSDPGIVSWNTILAGFKNYGDTFSFACRMNSVGVVFDAVTYTIVLAHCADHKEFLFGIQLHSLVLKCGLGCDIFIGNALVTMYSKWERVLEAERVFGEMPIKDLITWNAMLSGYSQEGNYEEKAISTFVEMVRNCMKLDNISFTSAISACGHARQRDFGKQIHCLAFKRGYGTHVSVCNVLISMYFKCEKVEDAKLVFESMSERNVVSWTTMLSINKDDAMSLFSGMRTDEVYPNEVTFVGLIHSITLQNMVQEGLMIHGLCIKTSFLLKQVVASSFITMYARFEAMKDSRKIFEELEFRDVTSWNAIISGYAQNGMCQEALQMFLSANMEAKPNEYSFGSVLSAIASSKSISLKHGQWCHTYLVKLGLNNDPFVLGALLDMYAKRGSISESCRVFSEIEVKSQVAWTAIISAHARHGDYGSVMNLFKEMESGNLKPDSITFLSVLTACGRKGMVDTGKEIFESMVKVHDINPSPEHYSCMVDMLGRAGKLKEAEEFVNKIPGGPGLSVLQSLLGSCKVHGDVETGKRIADASMKLEPTESGSYVLMSNLYAEKGHWEKVAKIRKGMRDKGVKKEVGFSWVDAGDIRGPLHMFSSDDTSHVQTEEIYSLAQFLGSEMKSELVEV